MLPESSQSLERVRDLRDGPAGSFVCALQRSCVRTVRGAHRLADIYARLSTWLTGRAVPTSPWTGRSSRCSTDLIGIFSDDYSAVRTVVVHSGTRSGRRFSRAPACCLRHLAEGNPAVRPPDSRVVLCPPLFVSFCRWMQQQRGTCDSTLANYGIHICESLRRIGEEPARMGCARPAWFVLEGSRMAGWAVAKKRTTALRMFLRFLIAEGRCASELLAAVPVLVHRRLSSLPRYLSADEVERVIASCDRDSAVGQRDRAILLLLARLGLRAGDIVHLRRRDIDWKAASIQVSGKSRRQTRLPLTRELGDALVTYLTREPAADRHGHSCSSQPRPVSRVPLALCRVGDRRSRLRPRGRHAAPVAAPHTCCDIP